LKRLASETFMDLCKVVLKEKSKMKSTSDPLDHMYSQSSQDTSPPESPVFEPPTKKHKTNNKEKKPQENQRQQCIMCSHCLDEDNQKPFRCFTKQNLDRHVRAKHCIRSIACAICFDQSGLNISFDNEKQFSIHMKTSHT